MFQPDSRVVLAGQVAGTVVVGEGLLTGYQGPRLDTPPRRAQQATAALTDGRMRLNFRLPINQKDEVREGKNSDHSQIHNHCKGRGQGHGQPQSDLAPL